MDFTDPKPIPLTPNKIPPNNSPFSYVLDHYSVPFVFAQATLLGNHRDPGHFDVLTTPGDLFNTHKMTSAASFTLLQNAFLSAVSKNL
jgi:hypothetical protein